MLDVDEGLIGKEAFGLSREGGYCDVVQRKLLTNEIEFLSEARPDRPKHTSTKRGNPRLF